MSSAGFTESLTDDGCQWTSSRDHRWAKHTTDVRTVARVPSRGDTPARRLVTRGFDGGRTASTASPATGDFSRSSTSGTTSRSRWRRPRRDGPHRGGPRGSAHLSRWSAARLVAIDGRHQERRRALGVSGVRCGQSPRLPLLAVRPGPRREWHLSRSPIL